MRGISWLGANRLASEEGILLHGVSKPIHVTVGSRMRHAVPHGHSGGTATGKLQRRCRHAGKENARCCGNPPIPLITEENQANARDTGLVKWATAACSYV